MFCKLQYSVTFPSTGRTLSNSIDFTPGYAAITGPNESGKSMVFEMLRFGLFGTAALRGAGDDYKTLTMSAEFIVKGERYKVERTIKKATLWRRKDVIATGTTAVNQKIVQILGFGLPVFDMACSINQGEVERLGAMKPAERKRLVDGVLGIDALDVVAKWGLEEARLLDGQAGAIRSRLVVPVQPTVPTGYQPGLDLAPLRAAVDELNALDGWLAHLRSEPVPPLCKIDLPADNLVVFADKRAALRNEIAGIRATIEALPTEAPIVPEDIDEQWERYNAYEAAQRWLKANPWPRYNFPNLMVFQKDWEALDNIDNRARLLEQIERLKGKGSIKCPHCGEQAPLAQEEIDQLQKVVDQIEIPDGGIVPPRPPIRPAEIERELEHLAEFDEAKHQEMTAVPAAPKPAIPLEAVPVLRAKALQAEERLVLLTVVQGKQAEFDKMPDYEAMLAERRAYEAALPRYQQEKEAFLTWQGEKVLKEQRKAQLAGSREELARMEPIYLASRDYEQAMERFGRDFDAYTTGVAEADALEAKATEYRKVREVMNVLRSLIKQHLMPSLNKVASHLVNGMTGGQRTAIYVDEDFNVTVDQQPLDTLSGSGKACANLALRIALGQVLTNRVMSVLLADEIDASMDEFRAEQTSDVLWTLQNSVSQVLLVSHKSIEAPNHIRLGSFNGPEQQHLDGEAA